MARGRDRWQALGKLGDDYRQVEQELEELSEGRTTGGANEAGRGPAATPSAAENATTEDLEQAWSRFEAEQDLEQLRRRQAGG
jgi:hypothetical protein